MTHKYYLKPFKAWHMSILADSESTDGFSSNIVIDDPVVNRQLEQFDSYSLFDEQNQVIACGGYVPFWPGRYVGWMYITPQTAKCMLLLTRLVHRTMEPIKGRIEITVRKDFAIGHRWALLLGFSVENPPGILKQYGPEGEDHIAYVRFN